MTRSAAAAHPRGEVGGPGRPGSSLAGVLAGLGLVVLLVALVGGGMTGLASVLDEVREPAEVPAEYEPLFRQAAADYPGVRASVLAAQAKVESGWDADAVSPRGAEGLLQFMPATWAQFGRDADGDGTASPFDPADAVDAAARYRVWLDRQVRPLGPTTTPLVTAAYNAGPSPVLRAGGVPDYPETQGYVRQVERWSAEYAHLDDPPGP